MVNARFINDTKTINVRGENQETSVNVVSETEEKRVNLNSTARHDTLIGRDLPNQHTIDSITGLREIVNQIETFIYEQGVASDTWVIQHNLNKYPSVTIVDSAGSVFYPAVQYDNENQCTVRMNGATTGKAYLN